ELVLETWQDHFVVLKADLKKAVRQISFTADIWSADNLNSYLTVTAHWIGQDKKMAGLTLKAALIAFHHLPSCHTGNLIARTILQ
ncbi:hypothetical protein PISMIDRAFT_82015, partial [Pisolithus microcarpus 441]